jgi:hypothetical protein
MVDKAQKTTWFSLGESLVFKNRFFQGGIDAVAVWDRPLSDAEIERIYQSSQHGARTAGRALAKVQRRHATVLNIP